MAQGCREPRYLTLRRRETQGTGDCLRGLALDCVDRIHAEWTLVTLRPYDIIVFRSDKLQRQLHAGATLGDTTADQRACTELPGNFPRTLLRLPVRLY